MNDTSEKKEAGVQVESPPGKNKPVTEKVVGKPRTEAAQPVKYPIGRLRDDCSTLFEVSATTFAGATQGMTGEYTLAEVEEKIKSWQKGQVK